MTSRTPPGEVFWALLSSSKHSGVPKDSNSGLFQVLGFTPTLGQSRGATRYHLPTYFFMTYLLACLPFYNLPTTYYKFVLVGQKFDQSKLLIKMTNQMVQLKKPPQSPQTCQNQLVQNDGMVFSMLVQIGYFLTKFANQKVPCFLVVLFFWWLSIVVHTTPTWPFKSFLLWPQCNTQTIYFSLYILILPKILKKCLNYKHYKNSCIM